MKQPTPLLESLAFDICDELLNTFEQAEEICIKIEKTRPPVAELDGSVAVSLVRKRDDKY
jgi:dihydroneopterin aldolase